ncbi:remorin-like [Chenopodium quinoa]|uniref:Remorin C-terminal domain-containing protein n=1 Tax=Chenopodium quinoa TaxID=63459 RepID=A0A803MPZ0_CHEQI|nr:remorin-like [Chenopodium quinoa]
MAEKEIKKIVESKPTAVATPSSSSSSGITEEKSKATTPPSAPAILETIVPVVEKAEEAESQRSRQSSDRDIALAHVEQEKRLSFIKAWEESEQSKAVNKAEKQISALNAWENRKKASIDAKLKYIEEELEKKKAEYAEKMKNMVALVHKQTEEKRAIVQARKGEDLLMIQEKAAKYRATGYTPKKILGCISF